MRRSVVIIAAIATCGIVAPSWAGQASRAKSTVARKAPADLADTVAGTYDGDVISDSRGASQSDVTITVVKVAPATVRVSSSYPRLPSFTVRLTRAMQTIQQAGGDNVFLVDRAKSPWSLDVTVDGASWSGQRRN